MKKTIYIVLLTLILGGITSLMSFIVLNQGREIRVLTTKVENVEYILDYYGRMMSEMSEPNYAEPRFASNKI